jgi:hypothetical protein
MSSTVVKKRIDSGSGPADYTGTVNSSGQPHGFGSFDVVDGEDKGNAYKGQFKNGNREGFGKETANDGRMWQGQFKENNLNGFIMVVLLRCDIFHLLQFKSAQGDVYEGLFKDGNRHGVAAV